MKTFPALFSLGAHVAAAGCLFAQQWQANIPQQQLVEVQLVAMPAGGEVQHITMTEQMPPAYISPSDARAQPAEKPIIRNQQARHKTQAKEKAAIHPQQNEDALQREVHALPAAVFTRPQYQVVALHNPAPSYPETARRRGMEGQVVLLVSVMKNGEAGNVQVRESSGFAALDSAAVVAVQQWRFIPARVGNIAVESDVKVPVVFKLGDAM